jgi:hypothetical protein
MLRIETVTWEFGDTGSTLIMTDNRGQHRVTFGYETWQRGSSTIDPDGAQHVAAAGAWTSSDTYVAALHFYETPHSVRLTCQFSATELLLDIRFNVSFGPTSFPRLMGKLNH